MDLSSIELELEKENEETKEFFESNLPYLMSCSLDKIPYEVIRDIAVLLERTYKFDEQWQEYANAMGIINYKTIAYIQASAKKGEGEQKIFVAMDSVIREKGSFGHIIHALLKTGRFDVLKDIESFVRNLVSNHGTKESECLSELPNKYFFKNSRPRLLCNEHSNNLVSSLSTEKSKNVAQEQYTIKSPTPFNERKLESDSYQQFSINSSTKRIRQFPDPPKASYPEGYFVEVPSAPEEEEEISVLVQHTDADADTAEELAAALEGAGMRVTTLAEVTDLTLFNPTNALNTVFQEVDFIVPIVSSRFLEEIKPRNLDLYLDSSSAQNNRILYDLIMNEYRLNRCINFRVRPVIMPGMSRRLLMTNVVLSYSLRLWDEVPKLKRVLRETRRLRAQQLVR